MVLTLEELGKRIAEKKQLEKKRLAMNIKSYHFGVKLKNIFLQFQ